MNFAVYTKDGCPYCDKVKKVLKLTESRYVVYNLGTNTLIKMHSMKSLVTDLHSHRLSVMEKS